MNGYFDNNATTPLFRHAQETLINAIDKHWANPSSLYSSAGAVKRLLEDAREHLADSLGVDEPERVVFTNGATESNNCVIRHVAARNPQTAIALSAIEHPSLIHAVRESHSEVAIQLPITQSGTLDLGALRDILQSETPSLVSVMAANNETGVAQPWRRILEITREFGIPFHSDASQWIGKLPSEELGQCDWLSGCAHKFGGPKGIGFLVLPSGTKRLQGSQTGGPQERGLRAGTENYPAIASMIAALDEASERARAADRLAAFRDAFELDLLESIPNTKVCGQESPRLWNTSMLVMPQTNNLKWLTRLSDLGFSVSTGSACSSGKGNPSHVMEAMGLDHREMSRVIRVSGSWQSTAEDWIALARAFAKTFEQLSSNGPEKRGRRTISLTNIDRLP